MSNSYSHTLSVCKLARLPICDGIDLILLDAVVTMQTIMRCPDRIKMQYLKYFRKDKQSELSTHMQNGSTHPSRVPAILRDYQSQQEVT